MIIEENKVGWEPEIFDFVSLEIPGVAYEETIKKLKHIMKGKFEKLF